MSYQPYRQQKKKLWNVISWLLFPFAVGAIHGCQQAEESLHLEETHPCLSADIKAECRAELSAEDWGRWLRATPRVSGLEADRAGCALYAVIKDAKSERVLPKEELSPGKLKWLLSRADSLIEKGYVARGGQVLKPFSVNDWGGLNKNNLNENFTVNSWGVFTAIVEAHQITLERNYLEALRSLVLDWIDYNLIQDRSNKMKWYDMATGRRAVVIAHLIAQERIEEEPCPARLEKLLLAAEAHRRYLSDPLKYAKANHGLFQMYGLKSLLFEVPKLRMAEASNEYADAKIRGVLEAQYRFEHLHQEDSPEYHFFVTETVDDLEKSGVFSDDLGLKELVVAARSRYHELVHPDGKLVQIGDSSQSRIPKVHPFQEYIATHGKKGEKPPEGVRFYPKTGYALYRSPFKKKSFRKHDYLFVSASAHDIEHTHADFFSFEWSARGSRFLVDSGKFTYDHNQWRDYFTSTKAGNTVEIDGRSHSTSEKFDPKFPALKRAEELPSGVVLFQMSHRYQAVHTTHQRSLILMPGEWLLVFDEMRSLRSHQYTQWFHAVPEYSFTKLEGSETKLAGQWDAKKKAPKVEMLLASTASEQLSLHLGEGLPNPQGWISASYKEKEKRQSLAHHSQGKNVAMAALFQLGGAASELQIAQLEAAYEVRWIDPKGQKKTYQIVFDRKQQLVKELNEN